MTVSVLLCDDLPEERANLRQMLRRYADGHDVELNMETAADGAELLSLWRPGRWDIIFLDIFMPQINGIETARRLRKVDRDCQIVFATTSREHGMEGHELHAMDYLTKPFAQQDVDGVMDWFLQEHLKRNGELTFHTPSGNQTIRVRDIRYIESIGHTCVVHLPGKEISTRASMRELIDELGSDAFFCCHKSFLINLEHAAAIEKRAFVLDDGGSVPISAANLARSREALSAWRNGSL